MSAESGVPGRHDYRPHPIMQEFQQPTLHYSMVVWGAVVLCVMAVVLVGFGPSVPGGAIAIGMLLCASVLVWQRERLLKTQQPQLSMQFQLALALFGLLVVAFAATTPSLWLGSIVIVCAVVLVTLASLVQWRYGNQMRNVAEKLHSSTSQLKRRESLFRTITEMTSDYIFRFKLLPGGALELDWVTEESLSRDSGDSSTKQTHPGSSTMIHPDDWFILDELAESALNGGTHVAEFRIINREGDARWLRYFACAEWDEAGEHVVGILGAAQDVTERKHHEQQIEQLAYYDALSGLANRRLLHLRTAEALDIAQKRERPFAVLYLDLDRFKAVNDTLGHETGDDLLKQVAERLRTCVRTSDLLARLGGDEFAVLLTSADEKQAIAVAQRMLHQFDQAFVVRDHRLWVGGSIGIACYPRDGAQVGTLLKHADIAMYRAKGRGGQYQVYDETLNTYRHEQLRLEADLRQTVDNGALTLYYQPILNIRTGTTLHVEALVRWPHPEYGLVPPRLFIPIAEETGLIRNLDRWVIKTALQQVADWGRQGRHVTVAVNLSVHSLQDVYLVRYVEGCLRETGALSQQLIIEVTESAAMRDPETTLDVLAGLKALGMRIALDDFGSGYASLKYLKQLPVDSIKVDRSFVQGIGQDEKDEAVLQTLVSLGKGLGLAVVAEGVEHNEQLSWLSRVGYDQAQGYLIGRPMPAESLVVMRLPYSLLTLEEGAPPTRVAVSPRSTTPAA